MANYPHELAQDAVRQSHTGHMNGLCFLPARPLRLNTNEWMNVETKATTSVCYKFRVSFHKTILQQETLLKQETMWY